MHVVCERLCPVWAAPCGGIVGTCVGTRQKPRKSSRRPARRRSTARAGRGCWNCTASRSACSRSHTGPGPARVRSAAVVWRGTGAHRARRAALRVATAGRVPVRAGEPRPGRGRARGPSRAAECSGPRPARAIRLPDASGAGDARSLVKANHWAGTELHILNDHELVVITTDDRRPDHVRGGAALQAAVLAGRVAGVAVRPVVHLVHRREWRAGLIERYGLAGFPQALAIVGAKGPVSTGPTAASTGQPRS